MSTGEWRRRILVAKSCCAALLASLLTGLPAHAAQAAGHVGPPPVQHLPSVAVQAVAAVKPSPSASAQKALKGTPLASSLPGAGTVVVDVPGPAGAARPAAQAGGLQVRMGAAAASAGATAPTRVQVETLDQGHAALTGLKGVLFRVGRADGGVVSAPVALTLSYAAFRNAYGADWSTRLRLWSVPECALTTPGAVGCRPQAVASTNDVAAGQVSGQVVASAQATAAPRAATPGGPAPSVAAPSVAGPASSGALFMLAASPSGPVGDFSATSLSPSATWHSGGSSGDFTWDYSMRVPPALGGPVPQFDLSYSSGSVDGRTAASNNQPSWIGEGFEMWPGYIERSYKACSDDMGGNANNTTATGDLCWGTDNATLSLGGKATELVRDDAGGFWRPKVEDGSRIERFTGGSNGDTFGQYWRVTTVNGTQYYFGLNHLPGWTSGQRETLSTWTVPVYGNNPGEPCYQSSFDASWCQEAWRWNLDYVVDPHGNSMSYWYGQETNVYGRNLNPNETSTYVRGGTLSEVDYGTLTGADFSTVPMRVLLTAADRCLPNTTCDSAHPASWPDTPWDQTCTGAPCSNASPAFFTQKRLAGVKTQVWGGTAYRDVESWTLNHTYPDPGDGTRAGLWLASISHAGLVGGTLSLPDVVFSGVQMSNRVALAAGDNAPPMNWWRISQINNETGGALAVVYSPQDCVAGSRMPSSPDQNTLRCFPVFWTRPGQPQPAIDWFHKYVTMSVSETDLTGGSPRVITSYQYQGSPAWHYDEDDGLVPASRKSWGQWRGYGDVQTLRGDPGEQAETESWYFRGMDGDKLAAGGTKSVQVTGSDGVAWTDTDALQGMVHEQVTYSSPGGTLQSGVLTGTISDPWLSAPTATRVINGTTVYARHTGTLDQVSRTALDGGRGLRTTRLTNTYDSYGMVVQTDDQGDVSQPSQEVCERYTYARNTGAWLMSFQSRVEKYALSCSANPTSADDVISDSQNAYDGQAFGSAPTKGDVTGAEALKSWSPGSPTYVTTSTTAFDQYGRPTDKWDVFGNHSTIPYTPSSGAVTSIAATNGLGHVETASMEPAWGKATSVVDANNKRTDLAYDPLGRLTGVWLPGRVKGTDTPNYQYQYLVQTTGAVAVTTQSLNTAGNYVTTYELYDGLLRPRQTQAPAPGGGAILTDTFYNTAGQVKLTYGAYNTSASPSTTLVAPVDSTKVPTQTATLYDGAGRLSASVFLPNGIEAWRTTDGYGGDRVDVTPPTGGTATSTVTDARGRTTAQLQYQGSAPAGAHDTTTYTYDRKGQLSTVTDSAGNQWSYGYDLMGRQTSSTSPDSGTTISQYDDAGQVVLSTDARGQGLAYDYDALGRQVDVRDGSSSGPIRAQWVYDTLAKGYLTSSTRYVNGNAYTITVKGYDTPRYLPTGETFTIPASEGALAGSYAFKDFWFKTDGQRTATDYPAAGGLPEELVLDYYDSTTGLPTSVSSNASTYVAQTSYSSIGQLLQLRMSVSSTAPSTWQTYSYESGTNRLHQSQVSREQQTPAILSSVVYSYDQLGNVTEAQDGAGQTTDTQCFNYDYLRRLSQAWTPVSNDCTQTPTNAGLGGPAPYWQQWGYDLTGNRTSQVDHATAAGDRTTTYSYPAPGSSQPHTLSSTSATDSSGTKVSTYSYDQDGNTQSRPGSNGQQQLSWDPEGHLSGVTDAATTTSYIYDADGNRLISHDAGGATLYLPNTELRLNAANSQVTATRYYMLGGQLVAQRTPSGLTWLFQDRLGTQQVEVAASDQSAVERFQTPFGGARGAVPVWPNDKGFVGGIVDPTGLVHLGAREYDTATGRFISADSVLDHKDPQQQNGYAYSNNSPITMTDPTGRRYDCDAGVDCNDGAPVMPSPEPRPSDQTAPTDDTPVTPATTPASAPRTNPKKGGSGSESWWEKAWNKVNSGFQKAVNWVETKPVEVAGALMHEAEDHPLDLVAHALAVVGWVAHAASPGLWEKGKDLTAAGNKIIEAGRTIAQAIRNPPFRLTRPSTWPVVRNLPRFALAREARAAAVETMTRESGTSALRVGAGLSRASIILLLVGSALGGTAEGMDDYSSRHDTGHAVAVGVGAGAVSAGGALVVGALGMLLCDIPCAMIGAVAGGFLGEKAGGFLGGFIYDHWQDGYKLEVEGGCPAGC